DTVKIGDSIEVLQPMGDFIYESGTGEVLLWGVGSGITPLLSIAKELLNVHEDVKVNLIYGNRNHETTIFFEKIQQLEKFYPDRFLVKHFHTKFKINPNIPGLIEGRINQEQAIKIIDEVNPHQLANHFICGPAGLKTSVKSALKLKGFTDQQIFAEDFELVKDPKDFEDINTQSIKLKFGPSQFDLEVIKGKSILESALDAGIELPYSCQTGNCSTCKGKLLSGEAKMIGLTKDREDLLVDEYLVCCTHPLSDNVYIEIA
ncbi:MAG: 2Fe-2S iron-sulfur cluster binding domain-containing protein, partial [Flavobacterium sp.]